MSCFPEWITAVTLYPAMATDKSVPNLSPGTHLHSNKSLYFCSPFFSLCHFLSLQTFWTENKLHFSRDRDVIIWAFRTSCSLWRAGVLYMSYFTGGSQLYSKLCTACTVLHMEWHIHPVLLNCIMQEVLKVEIIIAGIDYKGCRAGCWCLKM